MPNFKHNIWKGVTRSVFSFGKMLFKHDLEKFKGSNFFNYFFNIKYNLSYSTEIDLKFKIQMISHLLQLF